MSDNLEIKRIIHSIWLDEDTAECSLTSHSQGGPASGMNTVLLKANRQPVEEDLSTEESQVLKYIEEEFTPLQKQKGNTNSPSSSTESNAGEETNMTEGKEMSEKEATELDKANQQIIDLQKALLVKDLEKFNLENEEEVVSAMLKLEDQEKQELNKAFSFIAEYKDTELQAQLDKANVELENQEIGEDGEAELDKSNKKSLNDQLIQKYEEQNKG